MPITVGGSSDPIAASESVIDVRYANVLAQAYRHSFSGQAESALELLLAAPAPNPAALVASSEAAVLVTRWGANPARARQLIGTAVAGLANHPLRSRAYTALSKVSSGTIREDALAAAIYSAHQAGDMSAAALAEAALAFPMPGSSTDLREARRLADHAVALAASDGDQLARLVSLGTLAAIHTHQGLPTHAVWRSPLKLLTTLHGVGTPGSHDWAQLSEAAAITIGNGTLAALHNGEYVFAQRLIRAGRRLPGVISAASFSGLAALHAWRTADLTRAADHAIHAGGGRLEQAASAIEYYVLFERSNRPNLIGFPTEAHQLPADVSGFVLATEARLRAQWGEPAPDRTVARVLRNSLDRGLRYGWEDLAMALAELNPSQASRILRTATWPDSPRGIAAAEYVTGLLSEDAAQLAAAGTAFTNLGELLSAAAAFGAAARATSNAHVANGLRQRAEAIYAAAGADRSLAGILRDRRQRRVAGAPRIPESQRFARNAGLTPRQREVVAHLADGDSVAAMARKLHLAPGTIRNVIADIRKIYGGMRLKQLRAKFAANRHRPES